MNLTTIVSAQTQGFPITGSSPASPPPESTPASRKIQQAARQFETQLLTSVLAALEKSFGSVPGSEETGVSEQYHALGTQSLAAAWAAAGGIGIARILARALSQASATERTTPPAALSLDSLPLPGRYPSRLVTPRLITPDSLLMGTR